MQKFRAARAKIKKILLNIHLKKYSAKFVYSSKTFKKNTEILLSKIACITLSPLHDPTFAEALQALEATNH